MTLSSLMYCSNAIEPYSRTEILHTAEKFNAKNNQAVKFARDFF